MLFRSPAAFRSLSRLSSALSAKASSLRSLQLNLPPHSVVTSAVDLFLVFFVSQFPDRLSLSGLFVQTWPRMSFFFIQDLRFFSVFGFQGTIRNNSLRSLFPNGLLIVQPFMETKRFELSTPCLQGRCSPN